MGCRKLTYYHNTGLQVISSKKELTLKNSSQTLRSNYLFGFNGKENDNEVKGTGNQQDYGMRIYDPRLGRFLSVDPLTAEYPWYTPYQFAGNTPIQAIDLDGLEEFIVVYYYDNNGKYTGGTVLYVPVAERKLGNEGVLEVNMRSNQKSTIDQKYSRDIHRAIFFQQASDGTWSQSKGKYSLESRNKAVNKKADEVRRRANASGFDRYGNPLGQGLGKLEVKTQFIPMEYDNSILINGRAAIDQLSNVLKENPDFFIHIDGSASPENSTGIADYNSNLAWKRAEDVKQILLSNGVDQGQFSVSSSGTSRAANATPPVTANSPEGEKAKYRGVFYDEDVKMNPEYGTP